MPQIAKRPKTTAVAMLAPLANAALTEVTISAPVSPASANAGEVAAERTRAPAAVFF